MTRTLVVFSLEAWDGVWRRNQYVIDGLLRADDGLTVLFVEPPRDVLHDVRSRRRPRRGAGLRTASGYGGRLHLFEPTKWLPRVLGTAADASLRRSVRRAMGRMSVKDPILWVNDPTWAGFVDGSSWPSLYDMTDDWLAANRSSRAHDRLVAAEQILMRECRAVVVCSMGLLASRRAARPDVVLIQNAVDLARYRTPAVRPADVADMRYAVYVGTLHEDRLDLPLVLETARRLREAGGRCVLVGPNALSPDNTAALGAEPGVLLLGPRPYEEVPGYLQHASALVVPHVVDDFTDSLDPIKLYEYLAVGRQIVSTEVAGFRELTGQPGVAVANRASFSDEVLAAVSRDEAVREVDVPDWSERVEGFARVLDQIDGFR